MALLLTFFHIFGVALGVGGATISDVLFFRALKDKRISKDEFALLHTLGYILWAGLTILFLSGVGFVTTQLITTGSSTYLVSAWFWAKMTIIFILFCNALVMHWRVFPFMQAHLGKVLDYDQVKNKVILLACTGVVSITSWFSALTLGVTRGLDFSYLFIINAYALLVAGGILVAYTLFLVSVFPKPLPKPARVSTRRAPGALVVWLVTTLLGLLLVSAAWYIANRTLGTEAVTETEVGPITHVVCVTEGVPWFTPEVLQIEAGDTVTWVHCSEDHSHEIEHLQVKQLWYEGLLPRANAHNDEHGNGAAGAHNHVHTHPILSVSGPESFSSGFSTVGHGPDGAAFSHTFTKEGLYEYICPTHPYMQGIIIVGAAPADTPASLWPPAEQIDTGFGVPAVPGIGTLVLTLQFADTEHIFPGAIRTLDTATWTLSDPITSSAFNNPTSLVMNQSGSAWYVSNWHADTVVRIDAETGVVTASDELGNAPAQMVYSSTTDRLYVAINNESRVAVLTPDGTHERDIAVPFGPHGITISDDETVIVVTSPFAEEVTVIDVVTETVVQSFPSADLPLYATLTPDGAYVLVSRLLADTVTVYSLVSGVARADIAVGARPGTPSITPDGGYAYVPHTGGSSVSVIDLATFSVDTTIETPAGPYAITFGETAAGGTYGYVTHLLARALSIIDQATHEVVGLVPLDDADWGGSSIMMLPSLVPATSTPPANE